MEHGKKCHRDRLVVIKTKYVGFELTEIYRCNQCTEELIKRCIFDIDIKSACCRNLTTIDTPAVSPKILFGCTLSSKLPRSRRRRPHITSRNPFQIYSISIVKSYFTWIYLTIHNGRPHNTMYILVLLRNILPVWRSRWLTTDELVNILFSCGVTKIDKAGVFIALHNMRYLSDVTKTNSSMLHITR